MNTPLSSAEEAKRLAELASYDILDSLPEQEYDDITQLAAQICGTPIALISLVDGQRQWFKASKGLPLQQTPRDQSFCAYNLVDPTSPLIVEDARLDDRFVHNPLVTGDPHIVFYAGVPLVDPGGHTLGSLCVIDEQVRQLTPDQVDALHRLARQVMSLLQLRRTNKALLDAQGDIHQRQIDIDFALQAASLGVWEVDQTTNLVLWDDRCRALFGIAKDNLLPYEQAILYIHPDDIERVDQAVQWAINPASDGHYDQTYRTIGVDDGKLRWVRFQGKAYATIGKETYRFAGVAQEVTRQVMARQQLEQSEARFRNLVTATPTATAVFIGRDMLIQQVNTPMLAIWGKNTSVIGKTLHVAMPELEGQPFLAQLRHVFDTGEPFKHAEGVADVIEQGQPKRVWFNHAYNPLYNEAGQIYGVINTATDVTEQVAARHALEVSQMALQSAIELAELGTWTMDIKTGVTRLSQRHADIFGLDSTALPFDVAFAAVHPEDRERVGAAFRIAQQAGSPAHYEAEYRIIDSRTGQQRYIRARGETSFDESGRPVSISGTTQDITLERELRLVLAEQVQQRTQELQLANQDLKRSNDNLQQFAYIASHDLQEPLRKIQAFSSLISQQLADQPNELVHDHLERITAAGLRMSTLIKDLLNYSRIATRQQAFGPVSLSAIVAGVLSILDWEIKQTQAHIRVDELPVANGDESQLSQLFQNLLTNALKFVAPGVKPQIHIAYAQRSHSELPPEVLPAVTVPFYHQISINDQGIGFDKQYLDRIFQVFQRLHGRGVYPGTGVGLAICQRVVENHGGAITADSEPEKGATFCVYLPA